MNDQQIERDWNLGGNLVGGAYAADPLLMDDAIILMARYPLLPVRPDRRDGERLRLNRMLAAAYSLGARHALERGDGLCAQRDSNIAEEESICLGDEPRPPVVRYTARLPDGTMLAQWTSDGDGVHRIVSNDEIPPDVQADIRDYEAREEASRGD